MLRVSFLVGGSGWVCNNVGCWGDEGEGLLDLTVLMETPSVSKMLL